MNYHKNGFCDIDNKLCRERDRDCDSCLVADAHEEEMKQGSIK